MSQTKSKLLDRFKYFEEAKKHKFIKYTGSGLLILLVGLLLLSLGLFQDINTGDTYIAAWLVMGLGTLIAIIGIIRMLIGFINPIIPSDLRAPHQPLEDELEQSLFQNEETN